MRSLHRRAVVSAVAVLAVLMLPTAASADSGSTGQDFGRHVVLCAQGIGFDGQHNPGMHQGISGWDSAHMC